MNRIELCVPACIVWKNKNYYLNLNNYRNWHYQVSNILKRKFKQQILDEVSRLPNIKKIESLEYELIVPSKTKRDRMNIYSIVDKFFCDALQEYKIIEDDSDEYIKQFIFKQSKYIKDKASNIRVFVTIFFE